MGNHSHWKYHLDGHKLLKWIYNTQFKDKFPEDQYEVIFEPDKPVIDRYMPDILIRNKSTGNIELWIEVGSFSYKKGKAIEKAIGEDKLVHISWKDLPFKGEKVQKHSLWAVRRAQATLEKIKKALEENDYVQAKAAKALGMTKSLVNYYVRRYSDYFEVKKITKPKVNEVEIWPSTGV